MAEHDLWTLTNPSSAETDFSLILDASLFSTDYWNAIDTADFTKSRFFKADGTTELAFDWIDPVDNEDGTGTGLVRVKWTGTLASSGVQKVWAEPPLAANASYAAGDAFGRHNAYNADWVGYWPCGEASGNLVDRTANGRDATPNNTPTYRVTGQLIYAVDLQEGDADSFTLMPKEDDPFGNQSKMSVLLWAEPDSLGNDQRAISRWDVGNQFLLWMDTGGSDGWAGIVDTASGQSLAGDGDANATADVWQQAGFSYDETAGLKIYVNGSESDTAAAGGGAIDPNTATASYIGESHGGDSAAELFDGALCEIQLHSTDRSAPWIAEEYAQTNDNAAFWTTREWVPAVGGISIPVVMHHFAGMRR